MNRKRVVLVSGHYLQSPRRAGFHWLARAYHELGWEVTFVTAALSWLSYLRRDYRLAYPVRAEANRLKEVEPGLHSFVWFTPWHPANLRLRVMNRLAAPWYRRYASFPLGELAGPITAADLIIFESTPALPLAERVRQMNPRARLVYRVSDDMHVLGNHPMVLEAERRLLGLFDLVSVVSEPMLDRFGDQPHVRLDRHGIDRASFDAPCASPYDARWSNNAVWVGTSRLDVHFLRDAAAARPDWGFHIIGPVRRLPRRANVIAYGELAFERTVPYLKHADIALYPLPPLRGLEVFVDSLKMRQYTYCQLPVVAPSFLAGADRPHVCGYVPGDAASLDAALVAAQRFDRALIESAARAVRSWTELATELAGDLADDVDST